MLGSRRQSGNWPQGRKVCTPGDKGKGSVVGKGYRGVGTILLFWGRVYLGKLREDVFLEDLLCSGHRKHVGISSSFDLTNLQDLGHQLPTLC